MLRDTGFSSSQRRSFVWIGALVFLATLSMSCTGDVPGRTDEGAVAAYDPSTDPLVNPPSLFEPFPEDDPSRADLDATLIRRVDASPTTLNPIFNLPWWDHYMHTLLFVNPFRRIASMDWVINDDVIESWTESDDNKTFTLSIDPRTRWHDGEPWTAHDIVFSFQAIADESVPALFYKRSAERLVSVRALDDHTIEFVHREALATRIRDMSFPIIPKHVFDVPAERAADPTMRSSEFFNRLARESVVGSGPYTFVEWRTNDQLIVERWDDYPFTRARFKRQVIKIIPDTNVALLLFKKGELHEMSLVGQQFATQTNDAEFEAHGVKAYGARRLVAGVGWNADGSNPFFGDVRVRRAMAHAFDRQRFLKNALYNVYPESRGIFDETHWAYNPDIERIPYDLEAAGALLDEAGWLADPDDGWRYKEIDGERVKFEFELLMTMGVPSFKALGDIFGSSLRRIGVALTPAFIDGASIIERLRQHEVQSWISVVEVSSDPDEWSIYWETSGYDDGYNFGGYSNPRIDELFEQARFELDQEKRRPLYQEIQKILYDEQAYNYIYDYALMWAFSNKLHGIGSSPSGPILFYPGITTWWMEAGD